MSIQPGALFGPYEVVSPIGAGGMGEVHRARDARLNRDVALKVLPALFAADADRLARFQREAQVLALLNHPNIGGIYGIEEGEGVTALVLELVEGPTLADRLGPGRPVPIEDALGIARQICDALEAAHEKGIVHRDLKPANIKITPAGMVKVLDFGLAKMRDGAGAGLQASAMVTNSPTVMASMPGAVLGTAAYMSPEQAKGKDADRTSDVWAFGCVLYEMLTGRAAFEGETVSEIVSEVLKSEPDWQRLPPDAPQSIRRLLRRCLYKDRRMRLHDIADARIEIEDTRGDGPESPPSPSVGPRRRERMVLLSALALMTLVAVISLARALRPAPAPREMRLEVTTPATTDAVSLAVSPDGRRLIFAASSGGRSLLWARSLETGEGQPLAGTDGGVNPFWSPDSRSVGFFADGRLKRIDLEGGAIQSIATVGLAQSGAWNKDGIILFGLLGQPLQRISASGGQPAALSKLVREGGAFFPHFLPDGRHFLYYVRGRPEVRGVYVGDLEDGSSSPRLLDADMGAVYVSGHVLFSRQATLLAQPFDPIKRTLEGSPFAVAKDAGAGFGSSFNAGLSASDTGTIVFRAGLNSTEALRQLTWFDRQGRRVGTVGDPGVYLSPAMAPEGRRLALHRVVDGNVDVWLLDTDRNVFTRLTTDPGDDVLPVWSADGTRIVFSSNRSAQTGTTDLYVKSATQGEEERLLFAGDPTVGGPGPCDWSPDGKLMLFRAFSGRGSIWALPLDGDRKPQAVVQGPFDAADAQFSPDGKWIAYQSNESGRFEIYLQPFPSGGRVLVSTEGGAQARWRRDGKELFYVAPDSGLMAVTIQLAPTLEAVRIGAPVPLFPARIGFLEERQQYVVSADGQRFLMTAFVDRQEVTSPITVILNWKPK